MNGQLDISFPIHRRENNIESQAHLEENEIHFSEQCKRVLQILRTGIRLTRISAATEYKIMSLERRVADINQGNEIIKKSWVTDETGKKLFKEYYL